MTPDVTKEPEDLPAEVARLRQMWADAEVDASEVRGRISRVEALLDQWTAGRGPVGAAALRAALADPHEQFDPKGEVAALFLNADGTTTPVKDLPNGSRLTYVGAVNDPDHRAGYDRDERDVRAQALEDAAGSVRNYALEKAEVAEGGEALCDGCDNVTTGVKATDDGSAQMCPACLPIANAPRREVWGISRGLSSPVTVHPSEESARAAAADVTRGGEVVRWRTGDTLWTWVEPTSSRPDDQPCPKCGGNRLRADFTDPTRCHVADGGDQ